MPNLFIKIISRLKALKTWNRKLYAVPKLSSCQCGQAIDKMMLVKMDKLPQNPGDEHVSPQKKGRWEAPHHFGDFIYFTPLVLRRNIQTHLLPHTRIDSRVNLPGLQIQGNPTAHVRYRSFHPRVDFASSSLGKDVDGIPQHSRSGDRGRRLFLLVGVLCRSSFVYLFIIIIF